VRVAGVEDYVSEKARAAVLPCPDPASRPGTATPDSSPQELAPDSIGGGEHGAAFHRTDPPPRVAGSVRVRISAVDGKQTSIRAPAHVRFAPMAAVAAQSNIARKRPFVQARRLDHKLYEAGGSPDG
jgi:hypothetical protein